MEILITIEEVKNITLFNGGVFVNKANQIQKIVGSEMFIFVEISADFILVFNDLLVVTRKDMPIYFIKENGVVVSDIHIRDSKIATYPIFTSNKYLVFYGIDCKSNDVGYIVDETLNKSQLFPPYYRPIVDQYIGFYFGETLLIKNFETGFEWQININAIPKKNIQPNPYTGVLEEQPNRFAGQPNEPMFAYNNILYVHTEAALMAFEISTGKLLFDDIFNGYRIDLFGDKIYAIHNDGLFVSDAQTGELLNSTEEITYKREEDKLDKSSTVVNRFITNIKVFEDYILCTDSVWGRIAFFDRKTLKRMQVVEVAGINARRDNIIWHQNRLYILGVGDVLFVYE